LILLAASLVRVAWVCIAKGGGYAAKAVEQRAVGVALAMNRGGIFDRNMVALTGHGDPDYMVAVFPSLLAGRSGALERAESLLGQGVVSQSPRVVRVGFDKWAAVSEVAASIPGVVPFTVPSRHSSLAAHVIGHVYGSGLGADGIERSWDDVLAGTGSDVLRVFVDANGRLISGLGAKVRESTARVGHVRLTLDARVQQAVEGAMDLRGITGAVVVMDPGSGDILAMASRPTFDPSNVGRAFQDPRAPLMNRAVVPYYPGSVFKVVVAAAALQGGVRTRESVYMDTGTIEAGGHTFRCYANPEGGHGPVAFEDALALSCNTAFIDAAQSVGGQALVALARELGVGLRSWLGIPGVGSGETPAPTGRLGPAELANLALGQAVVRMTPLEATVMMSAIANGGVVCEPRLVLEARDRDGRLVPLPARGERHVLSPEVAADLRAMLSRAAASGTTRDVLAGMDVAGKTGTAQTGRLSENGEPVYDAWFAGYAPAGEPKITVVVLVEGGRSGAASAAPVFRDICQAVLELEPYRY
jgi:peptidoglycan glycosyltransferase/penicillin-binding protein 2